eukprot:1638871-Amphidinium_carterae.2
MACAAMTTPTLRSLWTKAFGENQAKLVVAERTLALLHLAPVKLVLDGNAADDVLTEVLIVALVWGATSVPQDHLEQVLLCLPAAVSDESAGLVTLNLFNAEGDIVGDCNASYVLIQPKDLSVLMDTLPGDLESEVVTFS